jgi:hypothetical protein
MAVPSSPVRVYLPFGEKATFSTTAGWSTADLECALYESARIVYEAFSSKYLGVF